MDVGRGNSADFFRRSAYELLLPLLALCIYPAVFQLAFVYIGSLVLCIYVVCPFLSKALYTEHGGHQQRYTYRGYVPALRAYAHKALEHGLYFLVGHSHTSENCVSCSGQNEPVNGEVPDSHSVESTFSTGNTLNCPSLLTKIPDTFTITIRLPHEPYETQTIVTKYCLDIHYLD